MVLLLLLLSLELVVVEKRGIRKRSSEGGWRWVGLSEYSQVFRVRERRKENHVERAV
jgi:hypothetical protein